MPATQRKSTTDYTDKEAGKNLVKHLLISDIRAIRGKILVFLGGSWCIRYYVFSQTTLGKNGSPKANSTFLIL